MFLIWLLWLTLVIGGFYLGIGYGLQAFRNGGIADWLNAIIYCGCAIFCTPKLFRLFIKK